MVRMVRLTTQTGMMEMKERMMKEVKGKDGDEDTGDNDDDGTTKRWKLNKHVLIL